MSTTHWCSASPGVERMSAVGFCRQWHCSYLSLQCPTSLRSALRCLPAVAHVWESPVLVCLSCSVCFHDVADYSAFPLSASSSPLSMRFVSGRRSSLYLPCLILVSSSQDQSSQNFYCCGMHSQLLPGTSCLSLRKRGVKVPSGWIFFAKELPVQDPVWGSHKGQGTCQLGLTC